jgi:hypothetical protein
MLARTVGDLFLQTIYAAAVPAELIVAEGCIRVRRERFVQHRGQAENDRAELLARAEALVSAMEELTDALKALHAGTPNGPPLDEHIAEYRQWLERLRADSALRA